MCPMCTVVNFITTALTIKNSPVLRSISFCVSVSIVRLFYCLYFQCMTHILAGFYPQFCLQLHALTIIHSLSLYYCLFCDFFSPPPFLFSPFTAIFFLPFYTCSIMFALCASAHFRVTLFMSEVVVPIVRDTLTW